MGDGGLKLRRLIQAICRLLDPQYVTFYMRTPDSVFVFIVLGLLSISIYLGWWIITSSKVILAFAASAISLSPVGDFLYADTG